MEWKLFDGATPYVSTFDYHKDRPRAPHLEQSDHRPRLELAAQFVRQCYQEAHTLKVDFSVVDLGCGDGGLLQLLNGMELPDFDPQGYDFAPSAAEGWQERGVNCSSKNVFPPPPSPHPINGELLSDVEDAHVVILTEVLEHLARPHEVLKIIAELPGDRYIVVSSPWNENDRVYADCHAWAWDLEGFASMIESAGFGILDHGRAGSAQVVRAINRR